MLQALQNITGAWSRAWQHKPFKYYFAFSLLLLVVSMYHNFYYLKVWQARPGMQINDLLLTHLQPRDFSLPIFLLEYSALLLVFLSLLPYPDRLARGFQMYGLVIFARTVAVYFVPLEPPKEMILLYDPIANFFLHSKDVFVTKDLFFSGHISGMVVFFFATQNRYVRICVALATCAISSMILWQHVHYTMDVLFAPIAAYIVYKLVNYTHTQAKFGLEFQDVK